QPTVLRLAITDRGPRRFSVAHSCTLLQLTRSRTVTIVGVFSSAWRWLADRDLSPNIQSSWAIEWDLIDETNLRPDAQAGFFGERGWGDLKPVNFQQVLGGFPSPQQLGVPLFCFCPGSLSCSSVHCRPPPVRCERRQLCARTFKICYELRFIKNFGVS